MGVTRAKKNLYLTSARIRMINGKTNFYERSRFVDEIDDNLAEKKFLDSKADSFTDSFVDYGNNYGGGFSRFGSFPFSKNKKKDEYGFDDYDAPKRQINYREKYKEVEKKIKEKIELKKGKDLTKPSKLSYEVGDKVHHVKFGDGVVLNIKDIGKDYEVTIKFDEGEEKTLFAGFAKLEKVEEV